MIDWQNQGNSWAAVCGWVRNPLVQVRALLVTGLGIVIAHEWSAGNQNLKHHASALPAFWQGEAAPAQEVLILECGITCHQPVSHSFPSPAGLAHKAAAGGSWHHLDQPLRQALSKIGAGTIPEVELCWSGAATGNAGEFLHSQQGQGRSAAFIIGNGTRSGDGLITSANDSHEEAGPLRIYLIGTGHLTHGQQAALGEILNFLESRAGKLVVAIPRTSEQLVAGSDSRPSRQ